MTKKLIVFGIWGCLIFGSIFMLTINTGVQTNKKQVSIMEKQPDIELLSFLQARIKETLKDFNDVGVSISENKDAIILETSLNNVDTAKQLDFTDEIYLELHTMNIQNGINRVIDYTVFVKNDEGNIVGELKFGDYLPER